MRPLHAFALRNYVTLAICTIASIAFLASGLTPVSGSKDLSKGLNGNGNALVRPAPPGASNAGIGVAPLLMANPRERSDAFNSRLRPAGVLSPVGPALTATKTDNTSVAVDPGATIMYTVVITNTGGADALNVNFTDTIDSNTTLVPGSVNSSPIAFDDSFTASGNIPIAPATSVLANDIDPDTGTNAGLTVTQVQGNAGNVGNPTNTTALGIGGVTGSVTLLANGTFTYEPPPGFTGNDTFTYQISDAGGKTGTGTVTIVISNMVWFIDNTSVAANSRGTFSQPFKTIANFNTVNTGAAPNPQPGHHVVLRPASGSYAEVDGINLRDSQTLTGSAVAFSTVFTADANSTSAYTTFASSTGTAPTITTTGAALVDNGVDLGSGNAVRGLNVGNTPGAFGFNGTAVGSLTIAAVSKTGTGGAMSISTSGIFGATVNFGAVESGSSPGANLNLVGVTGTLGVTSGGSGFTGSAAASNAINISGGSVSLTYAANVTKASTGALLSVAGGHTGTLTFNTGTLNASSGTGLQFDNADGTYSFNGTTTLVGGDAGIDILNGSGGTFTFGSGTTITSPTGAAFNVGASPGSPTVTYSGSITQNTSGQRLINIDTTTGNAITFQTGTITGGANSTGININAANGNVTFSNGMTLGTSGARMANQAVSITGGTGTYSLGAVSIFTSSGKGISASSADGTINCTSGTVDSSSGTAIDINGPVGLTSLGMSLTKVAYAGGANSGISLQKTSGSFTVTGTGSAGTGGTLQSSTNANGALFLSNVANIDLSWMNIQNNSFAIIGTNVGGFSLSNCSVTGNAGTGSAAIFLTDTTNAVTFLNDTVTGTTGVNGFNVQIHASPASTAAISTLTVTNGSYSNSAANGGFLVDLKNTASIATASFTGVTFSNNFSKGLQLQQNDNSVIGNSVGAVPAGTVTVSGCTFSNNNVAASFEAGTGAAGASGSVYYRFVNNNVTGTPVTTPGTGSSHAVIFANGSDSGGGTYKGFCSGNTIGNAATAGSGSGKGNGMRVFFQGQQPATMTIVNNTIRGCPIGRGIEVSELGRPGAGFGQTVLNIKITGNDVNPQDSTGFPLYAIYVGADAQGTTTSGSNVHSEIHGNTVPTPAGGACDTQCGPTIGMIAYETVNNASGTTAGTLFQTGPGGTVSADIASTNTGTAGKSCAFTNPDHLGAGPGGALTFGAAPATVSSVHPVVTAQSAGGSKTDGQTDEGSVDPTRPSDLLLAARGQAPRDDSKDDPIQKLTQEQLNWMVQAALGRWTDTGISAEDFLRLQAVTFDVASLSAGQLASVDTTRVRIDEIAAGYGWFFDQSPTEDGEFQVPVPDKELHSAHLSPARGKMDLLTVVMRELGEVYLQGKKRTPKVLRPLMEPTLSPGVRRLPLGQWKITPPSSTVGSAKSSSDSSTRAGAGRATQSIAPESGQPVVAQAEINTGSTLANVPSLSGKIPAEARHAVFNPATDKRTATGAVMKFNNATDASNYAAIRARRVGTAAPFSGETVSVGPFTLPPGKSVTIMFNVTVNAANTLPPGTSQVCNQGSVSATGIPAFTTDDPDVVGTNNATCTQLNVADLSVTKAAGASPVCSTSNITYTINYNNAGPAAAVNALVSDAMPAGTSLVSVTTPATWTRSDVVPVGGNGTITFTKASSPNAEAVAFTIVVSIDGTVADGAVIQNTATVSSATPDTNNANNTSTPTSTTVKKPPTTATVGGPQTICALGTTTSLGGNTPTIGTGTWSIVTGGSTGTFNPNATTPGATFTHATGAGPITLRWTISNAPCTDSTADVIVTITPQPTATVGGPQTICALGTTTGLGGNTPTGGATGLWTIVTGGVAGTFNPNATTPGATFTHTSGGIGSTITLRWTVSNAPCTSATADVLVTIKSQPTATVGGPQTICATGTTAGLGGNTPAAGETGTWSIVTGGVAGTFNPNANAPNATFTHTSGPGPFTLRWTVSNAPCTAATADVVITLLPAPIATAGGPQTICESGTTASLGGNTPAGGETGTWSIVTALATGTFNPNATTPGATFTPTSGPGTITVRWTVTNPTCGQSATADVIITVKQQPTATAGGPQTICALGTTGSLGGNTPAGGATGTWTIVTGVLATGTFSPNVNSPTATFTHVTGAGPITLRWTVTNAPCAAATADVVITITQPPTTATVGGPQSICDASTTASLGGNTPTTGTGLWTIQTGGATGTFNPNATTPGATFTPTSGAGVIVVRWTISNPPCPASFAEVTVTVKLQPTATAGGPQTICALSTTASLGGNTPAGGATGLWTIVTVGATGTFNPNATTPGATFTHATGAGPITLRWTVSNAPCTDATADVVITITQSPTTATVGGPQTICALSTTAGLGGNTPASGTGTWTVQSGGAGTFNPNATTPNATFTHTSGTGPIVLRWTITSPPCTASFAEVTITIKQSPTTATVGGPQTICDGSATAGLGGNTPSSGTGTWTVQSAGAGTFAPNANTPNATFTSTTGSGIYTVRWTISSPPCPDSFAEVIVTVKLQPTATTGGNQNMCAGGTSASLGGNTPAGGATGTWTIVTGGATGTFNPNANTPGATFTHTGGAGPITVRWTVSNAPCTNATADVVLTITQPPTTATAGGGQTIAPGGTTAGLGGNTPLVGAGMWSIVTGGVTGTFNPNASTPNATWTHVTGSGLVVLRWSITNPPCPASTADVAIQIGVAPVITCPASPVVASATTGQCQAAVSFTVTATGIPAATVVCTPPSGSTFPVGSTTVNCTATNGVLPNAMCSFTVKVNDTQPPVFTGGCPAGINTAAPATCPFTSSGVVTYATPAATDNCPGVTVACNPPSGAAFPVGTTTVTCTATDASNNTAQCTFPVTVASLCVQDDSNPGNVVLVNVNTGGYRFCCNGVLVATATTATVSVRGCIVTISDTTNNRMVQISIDGAGNKGTASIRVGSTMVCTITDRKLTNNACVCN